MTTFAEFMGVLIAIGFLVALALVLVTVILQIGRRP